MMRKDEGDVTVEFSADGTKAQSQWNAAPFFEIRTKTTTVSIDSEDLNRYLYSN